MNLQVHAHEEKAYFSLPSSSQGATHSPKSLEKVSDQHSICELLRVVVKEVRDEMYLRGQGLLIDLTVCSTRLRYL